MGTLFIVCFSTLAAIALLRLGFRGRKIDDHPLCRKCGFDLIGKPDDSVRCSECGAELDDPESIIHGHRKRQPLLITIGIGFLFVNAMIATRQFVPAIRDFDYTPYKPSWWLEQELTGGSPGLALDELIRRGKARELSEGRARSIADVALAIQADASKKWDPRYGVFVEQAHANGHLAPEQWQTYAKQVFEPSLGARPWARQGDPMPLRLQFANSRLGDATFLARYRWTRLGVDEKVELAKPKHNDLGARFSKSGGAYSSPVIGADETVTAELSTGGHRAGGQIRFEIWEVPDFNEGYIGDFPEVPPLLVHQVDVNTSFEILPADADVKFMVVDDAMREPMRQSIQPSVRRDSAGRIHLTLKLNQPPNRFLGGVLLRFSNSANETVIDEVLDLRAGIETSYGYGRAAETGGAAQVDVILRPAVEGARRSVDPTPIWGEEIVFKDVPVEQGK